MIWRWRISFHPSVFIEWFQMDFGYFNPCNTLSRLPMKCSLVAANASLHENTVVFCGVYRTEKTLSYRQGIISNEAQSQAGEIFFQGSRSFAFTYLFLRLEKCVESCVILNTRCDAYCWWMCCVFLTFCLFAMQICFDVTSDWPLMVMFYLSADLNAL